MKKRTYIVKIGIRNHCATTDREEACILCQQLEAQGKAVHLWSRPYCGSPDLLVEEDFWGDEPPPEPTEPQPATKTYTVLRDGKVYARGKSQAQAEAVRDALIADGLNSTMEEET